GILAVTPALVGRHVIRAIGSGRQEIPIAQPVTRFSAARAAAEKLQHPSSPAPRLGKAQLEARVRPAKATVDVAMRERIVTPLVHVEPRGTERRIVGQPVACHCTVSPAAVGVRESSASSPAIVWSVAPRSVVHIHPELASSISDIALTYSTNCTSRRPGTC